MDDPSALLERESAIDEIKAAVQAARAGTGGLLVASAVAGMGKTRLLGEARSTAARAGLRVLTARGTQLEREYGYGLVRQLFERLVVSSPRRKDWLAGAAGAAAVVVGPTSGPDTGHGDFALLHGLFWLTSNICLDGPVAFVLDDLHWADEPSLRFLIYLLNRLEGLPLLVVAGMRPAEKGAAGNLLNVIVFDPAARVLELAPLSTDGASRLLTRALGRRPDPRVVTACVDATRGNPLMLAELARAIDVNDLTPAADGAASIERIGSRAIARRVSLELHRLEPEHVRLAGAIAVLGERASLSVAADLVGLGAAEAMTALDALIGAHLVEPAEDTTPEGLTVDFVHPLVGNAVYRQLSHADRAAYHTTAVRLLADAGVSAERIVPHLLPLPPRAVPDAVSLLRRAADDARNRGAPEGAYTYVRRCLREDLTRSERVDLLMEAGELATWVDMDAAATHLREARALVADEQARIRLAAALGGVLNYAHRVDEAIATLAEAEAALPDTDVDLKRRVQATILNILIVEPRRQSEVDARRTLWLAEPADTVGGRLLECSLAFHDMKVCRPRAAARARSGMSDGVLIREATGEAPLVSGWVVLLAADDDEVMPMLDTAIAHGRRRGAVRDLAPAYAFRALGWLWRGHLAEAEADAREACHAIDLTGADLGRPWTAPYLAYALAEQGRLEEAVAALDWVEAPDPLPSWGAFYLILEARAHLLRLQNRPEEAVRAALLCGEHADAARVLNPALLSWRAEAALALFRVGREAESRAYAAEELRLARQWQAPRALGRALRVAGLIEGGADGLALLQESVQVLDGSPARLEHARSLVELGGALRRAGRRVEARRHLTAGLRIAYPCKAVPLIEHARVELRAAGGRYRRPAMRGPSSLTATEARVAGLAAEGLTNRDIAQQLFVTVKTVEVHLSSTYRKLGVSGRRHLDRALRDV